ncbi:MAG: hypothetical protein OEZ30_10350 [Candidatus Aminicenantes bacterium]|nr:hypothetical protein [Candidatus Aminicenantes bacterium]
MLLTATGRDGYDDSRGSPVVLYHSYPPTFFRHRLKLLTPMKIPLPRR